MIQGRNLSCTRCHSCAYCFEGSSQSQSFAILQQPIKLNNWECARIKPASHQFKFCCYQGKTFWKHYFPPIQHQITVYIRFTPASNLGYLAPPPPPRTIFHGCQIVHWDPLDGKRRCPKKKIGLGYAKLHGFYANP